MGWDGMIRDRMEWHETGRYRMGWDGMGRDGTGQDKTGRDTTYGQWGVCYTWAGLNNVPGTV